MMLTILLVAATAFAQVGTDGSILGTVHDASGASVPGAAVDVVSVDRGIRQTASTNADGAFEILALGRGFYSVTVTAKGFRPWTLERIELAAGQQRRVTAALEVGEVLERSSGAIPSSW